MPANGSTIPIPAMRRRQLMSREFSGMTFLITGATRGIGASTARLAGSRGAAVVISGTDASSGDTVVKQIRQDGGEATFVACDLREQDQVRDLMARTAELYGGIDVLNNNAAVNELALGLGTSLEDMDVDTFDRVLDVNLRGTWLCSKYALPYLKASTRHPSIVNITSTAAHAGYPGCIAYGASKGGVSLLTKNLALDLARYGIRVNAIAPGVTETEMVAAYVASTPDPAATTRAMTGNQLVKRFGKPDEIAELVCFVVSDKALFASGVEWLYDGGVLAWRNTFA